MSFVVLGLLLLQPQTIYLLNKQFEVSISLFYRASLGAIRSALKKLEAAGDVTFIEIVDNGRKKKIYSATDRGRAEFFRWIAGPIEETDTEVAILSRLFFLGLVEDQSQRIEILTKMQTRIEHECATLERLATSLNAAQIEPELTEVFRFQWRTLTYGISNYNSARQYIENLLEEERNRRLPESS